ncbi:hypothetical protein A6770_06170 [Nostoc minutum NIES-26]|uniref:Uncharacterized protein n=1 Tax=Nostoc minutum NIES-26 TaxID=1844469 RepID=A0A367Q317_9NOSO|nr:hypothetical protein A6770_06170 [Nostoc minutum NIES-26]
MLKLSGKNKLNPIDAEIAKSQVSVLLPESAGRSEKNAVPLDIPSSDRTSSKKLIPNLRVVATRDIKVSQALVPEVV